MKTQILKSTVAALLALVPMAQAEDKPATTEKTGTEASVKADANGTVTVEVDVNGKKETKTFKLGEDGKLGAKVGGLLQAGRKALGKLEKVTWLGVAAEPVPDDVRAQLPLQAGEGLVVRHLMPDSPATKAGLQEHDILTRLDDQILISSEQLRSLVKMRKPGDTVKLAYLRKGEKKEATATLVENEVEVTRDDVINWLKNPENRNAAIGEGRERLKDMEERLQELRNKVPGAILEKHSFLIGPDGAIVRKLAGQKLEEAIQELRAKLEKADVSPEEREQIRKSLEDALRNAREAVEKVEDLVKKNGEKKVEEKP